MFVFARLDSLDLAQFVWLNAELTKNWSTVIAFVSMVMQELEEFADSVLKTLKFLLLVTHADASLDLIWKTASA